MKLIVEHHIERKKKLYVMFVDIEKAYGKVDRKTSWDILKVYNMVSEESYWRLRSLFMKTIKPELEKMEKNVSFRIGVGIRQEYMTPPWLVNVHMDGVIKELKTRTRGE